MKYILRILIVSLFFLSCSKNVKKDEFIIHAKDKYVIIQNDTIRNLEQGLDSFFKKERLLLKDRSIVLKVDSETDLYLLNQIRKSIKTYNLKIEKVIRLD